MTQRREGSDSSNRNATVYKMGLQPAEKTSSLLFQPYRAVGYIASHIPFALQTRGNEHFVTTIVGHAYHVYNVSSCWRVK